MTIGVEYLNSYRWEIGEGVINLIWTPPNLFKPTMLITDIEEPGLTTIDSIVIGYNEQLVDSVDGWLYSASHNESALEQFLKSVGASSIDEVDDDAVLPNVHRILLPVWLEPGVYMRLTGNTKKQFNLAIVGWSIHSL